MDRKISLTILIALLLVSCAKAEILPTPTLTPIPTASPSPTPTEIPATPTETGPREGDTRIKEGVGEQVYTVIRDKEGNVMYAEWMRIKTPGDGIPILDFGGRWGEVKSSQMGNVLLVCSDKYEGCVDVPKFTHIDKTSQNRKDVDVTSKTLSQIMLRLNISDLYSFFVNHPNGIDFSFFLTDPENPLTWTMRPKPDSSVVEILTDWNDPILEGGQEIGIDSYFSLRSKILGIDENGRLIGAVAVNKFPPAGAEYIWSDAMFLHSAMVLQQEDVHNIKKHKVLRDMREHSLIKSLQGNPWIIIEPNN